jgi:2-keto-4-pentenoate hydratase
MGSSRQFRGPLIGPLTRSTCGWSAARCERGGPWWLWRRGRRSLVHPAAAVAWLANCLGPRGERLRAGWLVLSGGLTTPVPLEPGQAVMAELDGLGSVKVYPR